MYDSKWLDLHYQDSHVSVSSHSHDLQRVPVAVFMLVVTFKARLNQQQFHLNTGKNIFPNRE
jgi:hypothetical protein